MLNDLFKCLGGGDAFIPQSVKSVQTNPFRQMYVLATMSHFAKTHKEPIKILEIGGWAGSSTMLLCFGMKNFFKDEGLIFTVDPWRPYWEPIGKADISGTAAVMDRALKADFIYDLWQYNMDVTGYTKKVVPLRGESKTVLPMLKDGSFDMVYVDGNHIYEYVKEDLVNAKRLVRDGGLICGDDLGLAWSAKEWTEDEMRHSCIRDYEAKSSYHPGVSRAVWEELNVDASYKGFWASQKNGDKFEHYSLKGARLYKPIFMVNNAWKKKIDKYIRGLANDV